MFKIESNIDLHLLFIDFKKAYDSIDRKAMVEALIQLFVPRKLIRLVQMTLDNNKGKVAIQGEIAEEFEIKKGVKQGDSLSTILFNMVLEVVMRKVDINPGGTIYNRMAQIVAYADDIVIISRSLLDMKNCFNQIEEEGRKVGLEINERKTKYMIASRKNKWNNINNINIGTYQFERVEEFKYLGSLVTEDNRTSKEVNERIKAGNRCYGALQHLMKSKDISNKGKIKIYRTIIRPVVTYAAETWCLLKNDETRISVWERKILRRIFRPKFENGEWIVRNNKEIY